MKTSLCHIVICLIIARATRGHMIMESTLNAILVSKAFGIPVPDGSNCSQIDEDSDNGDLKQAKNIFDALMLDPSTVDEVLSSEVIIRISDKLSSMKDTLTRKRTSALWFQYMDMVSVLRMFHKAERT